MKAKIDWAFVDVKHGRVGLKKLVEAGNHPEITLKGKITGVHSGDDGVSIEFEMEVEKSTIKVKK